MALQFEEYQYSPLPTPTSIRLLHLHRTRGGILPSLCGYPLIQFSLHVVDLASDDTPAYEALSYTWDSPAPEWNKRWKDTWTDDYGPLCRWPVLVRDDSSDGGTPRAVFVRKNLFDALRQLLAIDGVDKRIGDFGHTRLHDAAHDGDIYTAWSLLERGASCGARDDFGETPLHYAAEEGHYEMVRILVASGADMNVYDNMGRLPVQCCVQRKHNEWELTARFLRDADFRNQELRGVYGGVDLEVRDAGDFQKTPLIQAAETADLDKVKDLVRRGAFLSAQDQFGETGLHYAAENGHYDVVKELVRAGADMKILDHDKRTPLDCCIQRERGQWEEVARFLKDPQFRRDELEPRAATKTGGEHGGESAYFWIDALCINQADLNERSSQVRIMPEIYTKANCVIVWLGTQKEDTDALKNVIHRVNKKAKKLKTLERDWQISLKGLLAGLSRDGDLPDPRFCDECNQDIVGDFYHCALCVNWDTCQECFARGVTCKASGGHKLAALYMPEFTNPPFSISELKAVLWCLTRAWFSRAWCIQELSLAKKIRMFLGSNEFDWQDMLKFLCLMSHVGFLKSSSFWKIDLNWKTEDGKGGDGSEAWRLAEIRLRTANNTDEWALIEPIFNKKGCKAPPVRRHGRLSLPLLIAATWSFESKDPRDKIYAILNLAKPLPPDDQIVIDYTSPIQDLYTQVAHIFFRGSGFDSMYQREDGLAGILEPLEGLSYVQDPYFSGQQAKMPELATWVPDFSNPLVTDRIWRRSFRAGKTIEPTFGPGPTSGILQTLGLELDVVEMVEPAWANLEVDDMPPHLEVDVGSWIQLLEHMAPRDGESPIQMLFRTISMDQLWEGCDDEARSKGVESFRDFMGWELAKLNEKMRAKDDSDGTNNSATSEGDASDSESDSESESSDESDSEDDNGPKTATPANVLLPNPVQQVNLSGSNLENSFQTLLISKALAPDDDMRDDESSPDKDSTGDETYQNEDTKDKQVDPTSLYICNPPFSDILARQRFLDQDCSTDNDRRFLPSDDEIPTQERLPEGWCKFHGPSCSEHETEDSFRFQMARIYRKRCLFRTRGGRLGLGPQYVKEGDVLWLFAGSRTPYLLRTPEPNQETETPTFRFLGEAYVHGVMYGEAVAETTENDWTTIHLK